MSKNFPMILMAVILLISCSSEKKMARKASNAVANTDYEKAISYYDQMLSKNKNSYFGNAGKGIVLSEYLEKHAQAIPYLEAALENSPKKTGMKLNYDLGKGFHYLGNYERALYYYQNASEFNTEDNPDYDIFLTKRIADCKYALEHPEVADPQEASINNLGKTINTPEPEYGPVVLNQNMLFTSKRQDAPKEKRNGLDGKYFEGIYISTNNQGIYSYPRRMTLSNSKKQLKTTMVNESILSASPDGKKLYIFRKGKVFEADASDPSVNPEKIDHHIALAKTHAFITPDGKTLLFSARSPNDEYGTDIYKATKDEEGNWSDPLPLDAINTKFNDEAPFLSEDGTLYFASNGYPGYGGYDMYKTKFTNGLWTQPENLGQPINSSADDIYLTFLPNSSYGYYSSGRAGGYGDMDIYQVHYVSKEIPKCQEENTPVSINIDKGDTVQKVYYFSAQLPENYQKHVKSYTWKINDNVVSSNLQRWDHKFDQAGSYKVSVQTVIYCDSCPTLLAYCTEKEITVNDILISDDAMASNIPKTTEKGPAVGDEENKESEESASLLGFNSTPANFDLNRSGLSEETKKSLDHDIEILKKNPNVKLIINGYADSRGSQEYNARISQMRANTVRNYFLQHGVPAKRIVETKGYGETFLTNNCTDNVDCTEEQHRANRRVEIKLVTKNK